MEESRWFNWSRQAQCGALEPLVEEGIGIRLGSEIGYVIGRVPASP